MVSWALALALVVAVRYNFTVTDIQSTSIVQYWVTVCVLLVAIGYLTKFYRGRFLVGSFDEALGLALHVFVVAAIALIAPPGPLPRPAAQRPGPDAADRSALLRRRAAGSTAPCANAARGALRLGRRSRNGDHLRRRRRRSPGRAAGAQRPDLSFRVVGYVDDNPGKRHLRIHGHPGPGHRRSLATSPPSTTSAAVILAIPGADGALIGRVQEVADAADLELFLLPRVSELIGGRVEASDIRRVEIADVLGRHQVSTDLSAIAGYLSGKRVLITGAGGSIGSELARQVHNFGPATLDHARPRRVGPALGAAVASTAMACSTAPTPCSPTSATSTSLRKVFEEHRPEIVFHAAALKHLPMLERFPDEGWKTNVLGTLNMLRLSAEFDVEHFVNISTDKAADATSVLGATKRAAEQLTAWQARADRAALHQRPLRQRPRLARLDAAHLQRADRGRRAGHGHPPRRHALLHDHPGGVRARGPGRRRRSPGEVMVLEMGEPVKILDVARRMIALSGARGIDIVFTGLRTGREAARARSSARTRMRVGHRAPDDPQRVGAAAGPGVPDRPDHRGSRMTPDCCPPHSPRLAASHRSRDVEEHCFVAPATLDRVGRCGHGSLRRVGVLDVPNHRSSHAQPVPRGVDSPSCPASRWASPRDTWSTPVTATLVGAAALGVVGLSDDVRDLAASVRLCAQLVLTGVTAVVLLSATTGLEGVAIVAATMAAMVWLTGFVNVYNFMDGANGVAALMAAVSGGWFAYVGHDRGVEALTVLGLGLGGAAVGFLPWNFPRARVFLGDVGSYSIGMAIGCLALLTSRPPTP